MIIAVDTGGTKTLIEAFDTDGNLKFLDKFPTPRDENEYVQRVSQTITSKTKPGSIEAIVVALPGPIRDNILVKTKNIGWENFDVISAFRDQFPACRIFIANDADLAGLAETRALERDGRYPAVSLYVTLSTGVGTGLCFDGKLFKGLSRLEGGAMRLDYGGQLQRWEDFASGRNFYERYGQYGREVTDDDKWRDYADRASAGLAALIPLFEPDTVVIGGSMGTHFAKYYQHLEDILKEKIPTHFEKTKITQAKNPEEAVIHGCYYYALDELAR